jgi:hypothetical protein
MYEAMENSSEWCGSATKHLEKKKLPNVLKGKNQVKSLNKTNPRNQPMSRSKMF